MWYAVLGSLGVGGISALVSWIKYLYADRARREALAKANDLQKQVNQAQQDAAIWQDQISRREAEITVLKNQKEQALDALQKSTCPGALRDALLLSLGISDSETLKSK